VPYAGFQRYFVTTCTAFRRPLLRDDETVRQILRQIEALARQMEFAVVAYCFMPDHLHLLIIANSEASDLQRFVKQLKQMTGYSYRQQHRKSLWQPGFHERILRNDEATLDVARYVLENPVRAKLAKELGDWPFAGSCVYSWPELLTAWDHEQT
jgi:putative transposase